MTQSTLSVHKVRELLLKKENQIRLLVQYHSNTIGKGVELPCYLAPLFQLLQRALPRHQEYQWVSWKKSVHLVSIFQSLDTNVAHKSIFLALSSVFQPLLFAFLQLLDHLLLEKKQDTVYNLALPVRSMLWCISIVLLPDHKNWRSPSPII